MNKLIGKLPERKEHHRVLSNDYPHFYLSILMRAATFMITRLVKLFAESGVRSFRLSLRYSNHRIFLLLQILVGDIALWRDSLSERGDARAY